LNEWSEPVQRDGSVGTSPRKINLDSGEYLEVTVENTHATNNLSLSADGKQHWKTIAAGKSASFKGSSSTPLRVVNDEWYLRGSAADTTYEIIAVKIDRETKITLKKSGRGET